MKKIYFLIYQNGLANVFVADVVKKTFNNHRRILQGSFNECEIFCRGLRQAEQKVSVAWDEKSGDISNSLWHFSNFKNAPFNASFSPDFVKIN